MAHSPDQRSSSPDSIPTQTFHPFTLTQSIPTLIGSAAGGAHYSGAKLSHRRSDKRRASLSNGGVSVQLDDERQRVARDLKELYECRPTLEIFERSWTKDAIFEDSRTFCVGIDEIMPQWYAMHNMWSHSTVVATHVISSTYSPIHPNQFVYSQTLEYTIRFVGVSRVIKSLILVELDENCKIKSLTDQRNGQDLRVAWGAGALRRLHARVLPWLVKVPRINKDK